MAASNAGLCLETTLRFSVLECDKVIKKRGVEKKQINVVIKTTAHEPLEGGLPVMALTDLLLHRQRNKSKETSHQLWKFLREFGFVVLLLRKDSKPGRVVTDMRAALQHDFFPSSEDDTSNKRKRNASNLQSGDSVYISERGVPMWRVGYELCDDIREAFRIHAGNPDSQPWPPGTDPREAWLRGLALCRHVCDEALHLTLGYDKKKRPGSGVSSWSSSSRRRAPSERRGDYSVLYAMHYFNDPPSCRARQSGGATGDVRINVKEHVDPSLFVLEPFLPDQEGLQVKSKGEWITCDGPTSPIHQILRDEGEMAMVLFVGKAFCRHAQGVEPTLHRVVGPATPWGISRRTMIYEQKYEEFFPPPALD